MKHLRLFPQISKKILKNVLKIRHTRNRGYCQSVRELVSQRTKTRDFIGNFLDKFCIFSFNKIDYMFLLLFFP